LVQRHRDTFPDEEHLPGSTRSARAAGHTHPWHDLPVGPHVPEEVTVVVETPGSSRNKYELEKHTGLFKLDRVLHSSVHYPGDYGFIPRTLFEDGDPLDVLLLIRESTYTGCLVRARPIGLLRMRDRGEPDDKVIAVPVDDPHQMEFFDIADIPRHMLREIEYFFATYKALEGKQVDVGGWQKSETAMQEIIRSMKAYEAAFADRTPS
jgi:inorganic pyrophosphatase